MARLLYVWDADYPWDVRVEKVCLSLRRAGHEVHIAARNRNWRPLCEDLPEGRVHRLPPWRWAGQRGDGILSFPAFISPRWYLLLYQIVHANRIELIISRDLPLCPTSIWVGRRAGIPVVFDMAENYPALLQDVWDTGRQKALDWMIRNPRAAAGLERYCLPRVQEVLTVVEEAESRALQLGARKGHVAVVSNTPPLTRLRPPSSPKTVAPDRPLRLAYMGLMEIARGVEIALEGLAHLGRLGARPKLDLIGGGRDLPLLKQRAAELGLQADQVVFYGYIPGHNEALQIVERADVGLIPHFANEWANTTIPNKLFDYMAAGLPVLSSDSTPCKRILAETGAGAVFQDKNPVSLADQISHLQDATERGRLAAAGRKAVMTRYNWEQDEGELLSAVNRGLQIDRDKPT